MPACFSVPLRMVYLFPCLLALLLSGCNQSDESSSSKPPESAAEQPKKLAESRTVIERSQDPLKVINIAERSMDGRNELTISFSGAVDARRDFQSFIYTYKDGVRVDGAWRANDDGTMLMFANTEPDSKYLIQIDGGIKSSTHQPLQIPLEQEIETRSLTARANFSGRGLFLSRGLGKGLPITAVNVDEVNIEFFKINSRKTYQFLEQSEYYRGDSWYTNDLAKQGTLVHSDRYQLDAARNTRVERTIDLSNIHALQSPGLYFAVMTAPGIYRNEQFTWFMVTDIGLHARFYKEDISVLTSSLKSSKALANVEVQLLDKKQRVLAKSLTDSAGKATLPFAQFKGQAKSVLAVKDNDYSLLSLNQPAFDLSEFDLSNKPMRPSELFIYSPRDLYRPGESLQLSALLRDFDGNSVPAGALPVTIKRPDGSEAARFSWQPQALAYYDLQWDIPSSAALGAWQVVVEGPFEMPVVHRFQVENFLPERMALAFSHLSNDGEPAIEGNDVLMLEAVGQYLHGAPAAGNRMEVKLRKQLWHQPLPRLNGYYFGNVDEDVATNYQTVADVQLGDSGRSELKLGSRYFSHKSPIKLRLQASLYEMGGRAINRTVDTLYWPAKTLPAIKPSFGDKNAPANGKASFSIISADRRGNLHAADLEVSLVREERNYFWSYTDSRGWHYQWDEQRYTVDQQRLQVSDSGAEVALDVEWGWYRLDVTDNSTGMRTAIRFHAGEDWYADWEAAQQDDAVRPDKVVLALDKARYLPGEKAQLRIAPPHAGEALILVESDRLLDIHRVSIGKEGTTFELPIDPSWNRHDIYISTLVLRPGDDRQRAITAKRSLGIIHLPLDRSDRQLAIEFDLPERILPGEPFSTRIKVSDATEAQSDKERYLTLAAVDKGVLSLTGFETPDPLKGFFGPRRYAPEAKDIYNKLIDISLAENAKQRFGGDADLARGGDQAQADVQIVSLFSGPVKVDTQGYADVSFDMPYFNGALRFMALAFDERQFGSAEQEVIVAAPVVTQLTMPRFLATGDSSVINLELTNNSGVSQQLDISLQGAGPVEFQHNQVLQLADGQRTSVQIPVKAANYINGQLDVTDIQLAVSGPQLSKPIHRDWLLSVRNAYPALTDTKFGVLAPKEKLELNSPFSNPIVANSFKTQLVLSDKPKLQLAQQLDGLLEYPYGCLEQTSSRVLPLLLSTPARNKQFALTDISAKQRVIWLEEAVARISQMQRSNGSFGLWSNRSPEERWLTAYVTDLLLQAREQGIAVSESVLSKSMERLQYYLATRESDPNRWSENPKHYRFAYRAYAGYVLAKVNQAPLGQLRQLYDRSSTDAQSGLPLMQLSVALTTMGDPKRAEAAFNEAMGKRRSEDYLGDYGSAIRDYALMLSITDEPIARAELSILLMEQLREPHWLSTQDRAALFSAGVTFAEQKSQPWQASLSTAGNTISLNEASAWRQVFGHEVIAGKSALLNTGDNWLYYNTTTSAVSQQAPESLWQGIQVSRRYYSMNGEEVSLADVDIGDLILVRLDMAADQRTPDALVVDLLPAGFELENQALNYGLETSDIKLSGESIAQIMDQAAPAMIELRDDRYVAALELGQNPKALVYLMRAVTPGTYQVPATLVEDMYRPQLRAIGETIAPITIQKPAR